MQDRPDAATLLDAVERVLRDESVPALSGATAYHARIAANLVGIAARQIRQGGAADAAETDRLRALLGADGGLQPLNLALSERLADGTTSLDDPAVADHLWRTTLAKIAIDQPRYPRLPLPEEP